VVYGKGEGDPGKILRQYKPKEDVPGESKLKKETRYYGDRDLLRNIGGQSFHVTGPYGMITGYSTKKGEDNRGKKTLRVGKRSNEGV